MINFIHIEKTGGMTLLSILERNIGKEKTFRFFRYLPPFDRWRDEVLSNNRNIELIHGHYSTEFVKKSELFDNVEMKHITMLRDPYKRMESFRYHSGYIGTMKEFMWDRNDEDKKRNGMTQRLGGGSLQKAKDFLKYHLFGITEYYDISLKYFKDWMPRAFYNIEYNIQNVTPMEKRVYKHTTEDYEAIKLFNNNDLELYKYAKRLFKKRVNK